MESLECTNILILLTESVSEDSVKSVKNATADFSPPLFLLGAICARLYRVEAPISLSLASEPELTNIYAIH